MASPSLLYITCLPFLHLHILPALEPAHKLSSPQVRMLPHLLFTLMLASALARGPMCSDGVAPTCTCSDGTLASRPPKPSPCADGSSPTCDGSPLVCPNGDEWVEGEKCRGRPRGSPACADSNVTPTCDDGTQPSFGRPGGRPGGRG